MLASKSRTWFLFVNILSACSPTTRQPLPTVTLLPIIESTNTRTLPTFTREPRITTTADANENNVANISDWEGLPALPEAQDGEPAGFGYLYKAKVTVESAEKLYAEEMAMDDWKLFNRQTCATSMFGGPVIILDFKRNNVAVIIMLIYSANENYTMVMISIKP